METFTKLLIEEIKIIEKMFKDLPYKIEGNKKSIKKLEKHFKVKEKKESVSSLWGIKIYLDPSLPDNEIRLISRKKTIIINLEEGI